MVIGFHDFFTSLKIRHRWMKPFSYIAKCQWSHDLIQSLATALQGRVGSDVCFDMRVYWDASEGCFMPAHGSMGYAWEDRRGIFRYLDTLEDLKCDKVIGDVYIRLILEREGGEEQFKELCKHLEESYPYFIFYGGVCKKGWKEIYKFKTDDNLEFRTIQFVGSMAEDARWYEKFIPILYAKRMNAKNLDKLKGFDNNTIALFDFIN